MSRLNVGAIDQVGASEDQYTVEERRRRRLQAWADRCAAEEASKSDFERYVQHTADRADRLRGRATVRGYAVLFGVRSAATDAAGVFDIWQRGSFVGVSDLGCVLNLDHDPTKIIASVEAGNLFVGPEDDKGLPFCAVLEWYWGQRLQELQRAGQIHGCSFSYSGSSAEFELRAGARFFTKVHYLRDVSLMHQHRPNFEETKPTIRFGTWG